MPETAIAVVVDAKVVESLDRIAVPTTQKRQIGAVVSHLVIKRGLFQSLSQHLGSSEIAVRLIEAIKHRQAVTDIQKTSSQRTLVFQSAKYLYSGRVIFQRARVLIEPVIQIPQIHTQAGVAIFILILDEPIIGSLCLFDSFPGAVCPKPRRKST